MCSEVLPAEPNTGNDLLGGLLGGDLDLDAALGAPDEDGLAGAAIDEKAQIDLGDDVGGGGDEQAAYGEVLDGEGEDAFGFGADVVDRGDDFDAARLAASADMDLGLEDDGQADARGRGDGFVVGADHLAVGGGNACGAEQLLRLVLVDFHPSTAPCA